MICELGIEKYDEYTAGINCLCLMNVKTEIKFNFDTIISIYHKNFYWTLMIELHYGWIEITELVSNQFVTQVNKIRAHEDIRKLELNDE